LDALKKWFMKRIYRGAITLMLVCFCISMNKETASAKATETTFNNPFFDSMLDGEWFLQPVLPSDTAVGKIPFIRFNTFKKTFTGNNGCNSMSGTFTTNNSSLVFSGAIITTKILCTGYNEKAFMDNLKRTNQYKIVNNILVLMDNGTELSKWTRKITPAPKTQKV
jgi:heat shock protein HslJ